MGVWLTPTAASLVEERDVAFIGCGHVNTARLLRMLLQRLANIEELQIGSCDADGLAFLAQLSLLALFVVGPEAPLGWLPLFRRVYPVRAQSTRKMENRFFAACQGDASPPERRPLEIR
jgi:hypothetical protein